MKRVVRHYFYFILFPPPLRPHDVLEILLSGPKTTERNVKIVSFHSCLKTKKKRSSKDLLNDQKMRPFLDIIA